MCTVEPFWKTSYKSGLKPVTYWIVLTIIKDVFTFRTIPWILFNVRRPNLQWSYPTCCLSYTYSTMPVDALGTLGARASLCMVLTPQWNIPSPVSDVSNVKQPHRVCIMKNHCYFCWNTLCWIALYFPQAHSIYKIIDGQDLSSIDVRQSLQVRQNLYTVLVSTLSWGILMYVSGYSEHALSVFH